MASGARLSFDTSTNIKISKQKPGKKRGRGGRNTLFVFAFIALLAAMFFGSFFLSLHILGLESGSNLPPVMVDYENLMENEDFIEQMADLEEEFGIDIVGILRENAELRLMLQDGFDASAEIRLLQDQIMSLEAQLDRNQAAGANAAATAGATNAPATPPQTPTPPADPPAGAGTATGTGTTPPTGTGTGTGAGTTPNQTTPPVETTPPGETTPPANNAPQTPPSEPDTVVID